MNPIVPTHRQHGTPSKGNVVSQGGLQAGRRQASRLKSIATTAVLALGGFIATEIVAPAAPKLYPGLAQLDYYLNIGGTAVADLTGNAKYPNHPDLVTFASSAQSQCSYGDNYGLRMRGLFTPGADGDYTFYISGDDNIELWLSTDENPANAVLVAREPEWNDCKQWVLADRRDTVNHTPVNPAQTQLNISVPVSLVGGHSYFFQALLKEGGGGDGVGVNVASATDTPPANGEETRLKAGVLSVLADDAPSVLWGPIAGAKVVQVGAPIALSAGYYVPPDGTPTYQWFENGNPIAGATDAALVKTADLSDDGAKFKVRITANNQSADSAELVISVRGLVESYGFAKFEKFNGISGVNVDALTSSQKYLDNQPDLVQFVPGFEAPVNIDDSFGGRVSGLFLPPVDGDYVFYVSADDHAELWLSTDEDPANVVLLTKEPDWANFREWNTEHGGGAATVKYSDPVTLSKSQRYYLMGLYKEGGGGDNFAATFTLSGDPAPVNGTPSAIVGARILNMIPDPQSTIVITTQPQNTTAVDQRNATFTIAATASNADGPLPVTFQWYRDGNELVGQTGTTLALKGVTLADSGAKFTARVFTLGKTATSSEAVLTVVKDSFPPAVLSVGALNHYISETEQATEITVVFDEPLDEASATTAGNYTLSGGAITGVRYVQNSSGTDGFESGVVITATGLTSGSSYTLGVKGVKDIVGNPITTTVSRSLSLSSLSWVQIGGLTDGTTSATFDVSGNSDFNLVSGGNAFWNTTDDITMVYEAVTGDFDRMARVEHNDPSSNWARSGISARESLNNGGVTSATGGDNPASRHQMVIADPATKFDGTAANNAFETNRRTTTGGATDSSNAGGSPGSMYPNVWVRLKRVGSIISMYYSELSDNQHWRPLGSSDFSKLGEATPLADTMYVGPTFGPENLNIGDATLRGTWATRIRQYGPTIPTQKPHGSQSYSIGLAFARDEAGSVLSATDVAGVDAVAQGNWNNLFGANTPTDGPVTGIVADKGGSADPTGVSVEYTSNNSWASMGPRGEENNRMVGADAVLMTGYLDTGAPTTTTVTITDIPEALTAKGYDVYAYALGGVAGGRGGGYRVLDGDGNVVGDYLLVNSVTNPTGWVKADTAPGSNVRVEGNYMIWSGITASKLVIEATTANGLGAGGTQRAPLNAVQLVASSGSVKPTISIVLNAAGNPVVTFTGAIEAADDPAGPYTPLAGAASPLTITSKSGHKYYRTR